MAENGRKKSNDALALALARGLSVADAAAEARTSVRTAYRRLEDPAFCQTVQRARGDMFERAVGLLADANAEAVATLRELLRAESESVRLGACPAILETGARMRENLELEDRIVALENARLTISARSA